MPRAIGARVACRARRASSGLMHKAALVDGGAARSSPPGTYAHTRPSFRVSPMAASRRVRHNATATVKRNGDDRKGCDETVVVKTHKMAMRR